MAVLECKALTKNYGHLAALDGVDFAIEPGRIVGLLGPNGSGKTTLIKLANGLLTPTSGDILVCGMAPGKETHALVSYLPGLDIQMLQHLLRRVPAKIGVEILIEVQKLGGSHPGGDRGPLRQVADQRMALLPRCYTTNKNLPTGRSQQAVSQLDESGLAASVGSQQSHDAARLDGKVHAVQRRHMPIIFCQCFTFQNRHPRFPPHLSPAAAGT